MNWLHTRVPKLNDKLNLIISILPLTISNSKILVSMKFILKKKTDFKIMNYYSPTGIKLQKL